MTSAHLLWWVFRYLNTFHRDVLVSMERELKGDDKHPWVNDALRERLEAWRKAQ